jgi:hypothetical protein
LPRHSGQVGFILKTSRLGANQSAQSSPLKAETGLTFLWGWRLFRQETIKDSMAMEGEQVTRQYLVISAPLIHPPGRKMQLYSKASGWKTDGPFGEV